MQERLPPDITSESLLHEGNGRTRPGRSQNDESPPKEAPSMQKALGDVAEPRTTPDPTVLLYFPRSDVHPPHGSRIRVAAVRYEIKGGPVQRD